MDADTDILQWWKQNTKLFSNLSKMAQELLAIPGTAVPSERVNSEAREMLPYTRNRLAAEKIEATLVLKSYLRGIGPGVRLQK
jgi:hAT family C-terminal dimerisation region